MGFERTFSSYQLVHLLKLRTNGMNGLLIADGVGVGKTISAGYIIEYCAAVMKQSVLVCCPPVLEQKWIEELKLRFGRTSYSVKSKEDFDIMIEELRSKTTNPSVYVIPYSTAKNRVFPHDISFGLVVYDEIHHARNHETNLFTTLVEIAKKSVYNVGLSATPIHNDVNDLSNIFSILFPDYSRDVWQLVISELWSKNRTDIVHPFVTKFDKSRLGIHFTVRSIHNIQIDLPSSYHNLVKSLLDDRGLSRGSELSSFEKMSFHRMASSSPAAFFSSFGREMPVDYPDPKLQAMIDLIHKNPPGRWLIFTEFLKTADHLAKGLESFRPSILSGSSSFSERYVKIDDFRKNANGIVIMLPVGCEGLDLQVCSRVVNYDLHWNPMVIEQRVGRIDRIGQEKKDIDVYNFEIIGSVDSHMLRTMQEKLGIVADTFADVNHLIEPNQEGRNIAEDVIKSLSEVAGLEMLQTLDKALPGLDYQISDALPDSVCDIASWPQTTQKWDDTLKTFGSVDVERILTETRADSLRLLSILSDYI